MARSLLVKTVAGDSFHIDVAEKALVSEGQRVNYIPTLELKNSTTRPLELGSRY